MIPPSHRETARVISQLWDERDAAEAQAKLYLTVLRDRHPFAIAVARWPGGLTLFALGVLTGMLIADLWGVLS
jgi:hypothetical protein